jgi:hypothetical protein
MSKAANPSRSTRKKTVRIAATAFAGIAGAAATALPAGPAQAARAYEVSVRAWGLNTGKGMQICGRNQYGSNVCKYAILAPGATQGSENWYLPNWWWVSTITLWFNSHHGHSWARCNVQNASHLGNWAIVGVSGPNTYNTC